MKVQIKLMFQRKEFWLILIGSELFAIGAFLYTLTHNDMLYDANSLYMGMGYSNFWSIYSVLFPFLIVLPFSSSYLEERENHIYEVYAYKMKKTNYLFHKLFVSFLSNFIVIFLPFLTNLVLCNCFLPHNRKTPLGEITSMDFQRTIYGTNHLYLTYTPEMPMVSIFQKSPFLYNFLMLLFFACIAGFLGSTIMAFSFCKIKFKIFLFLPWFIIFRLQKTLTTISFHHAMTDSSKYFLNYQIQDYIAPFTFAGKYYPLFFLYIFLLFMFIVIAFCYSIKGD